MKPFLKHSLWVGFAIVLFFAIFIIIDKQKDGPTRVDGTEVSGNPDQTGFRNQFEGEGLSEAVRKGKLLSNGNCEGEEKPKLSVLPMRYEDFSFIIPYGMTAGAHVTPIDHQYFSPTVFRSPRDTYEVRAMGDAKVVDIGERTTERGTEYRLVFSMSCKLFYYYDLVTSLTPKLKKMYDESKSGQSREPLNIPVKAGDLIGRIGGQTLDFAVWDTDVRLAGFVVPEHYDEEPWKIHTADPLEYYTEELKSRALSKYMRTAEPISGKIDYDIDGKLVGTWFLEGTGGYIPKDKRGGRDYWKGHLSVAYDYYDPTSIVVSMGDYNGREEQFGVKGNASDPAKVDASSGLIKYELVSQNWADQTTGKLWDRSSFVKGLVADNGKTAQGTVLIQMLEKRKIKFEAFPGRSAAEVSGFTDRAKIYER